MVAELIAYGESRILPIEPYLPTRFEHSSECIAPGSLDTSLSHAAGLSDIAVCHA